MHKEINGVCAPGIKHDTGKPPLSRVPRVGIEAVAEVLAFGAKKYDWNNWKGGMDHSRLIDAALRHIYKFADKKDLDEESGLNHLAHAACNLFFLLHYHEHGLGNDDR